MVSEGTARGAWALCVPTGVPAQPELEEGTGGFAALGRAWESSGHVCQSVQRGAAVLSGQGPGSSETDQFNQGGVWPAGKVCSLG